MKQKYPNVDNDKLPLITALHVHYHSLKLHLERLIEPFEGIAYIADKSRRLLKSHLSWLTGERLISPDDFKKNKDSDERDWDTPSIGTPAQWQNLITGMLHFYANHQTNAAFMPHRELVLKYNDKYFPESEKTTTTPPQGG